MCLPCAYHVPTMCPPCAYHVRRFPPPEVPDVPEAHKAVVPPGDQKLFIATDLQVRDIASFDAVPRELKVGYT